MSNPTSATIARDIMMMMYRTKQPPTGDYPNDPSIPLRQVVPLWYDGQPENYLHFIDEPAVDYTWNPDNPDQIVDPTHTAVTLACWSLACSLGYASAGTINMEVERNPYLIPSSATNDTVTQEWMLKAMQSLTAPMTNDDPWNAWGVNWPRPASLAEQIVAQVLSDFGVDPIDENKFNQAAADVTALLRLAC